MSTQPNREPAPTPPENDEVGGDQTFIGELALRLSELSVNDVVPPMFRLGEGKDSHDTVIAGHRILNWSIKGNESRLAEIAGWDSMSHHIESRRQGYIFLPEGTRNARSVLSGLEAYSGEKASVVYAAENYLKKVKETFGAYDTKFSWTSLAVTPEHDMFVAPPHDPNTKATPEEITTWKHGLTHELSLLLEGDEANQVLIGEFEAALTEK